MLPQDITINCLNAKHGEKIASTAKYPFTLLEYAEKKNKLHTVQNPIIPCVHYDQTKDSYRKSIANHLDKILADLKSPDITNTPNVSFSFKTLPILPDSGASICLAGPRHLKLLDICLENIIPCNKLVSTAGGSKLLCPGWVP